VKIIRLQHILPTRMHEIVHDTYGYRLVARRCVPGKLCECHKQIMGLCLEHLTLYEPVSGVFLNQTVTSYETWVHHFTVETEVYSTIENNMDSPPTEAQNSQLCAQNDGHGFLGWQWCPAVCGLLSHK
jgi:hypothetical protein